MKRIAYLRVSTDRQDHDIQRHALERYCKALGLQVEWLSEYGSGGSIKRRPVFRRIMRQIERGEVSHLYVFKLDRFARNTKDFLTAHEVMEQSGCAFISISDNLDFSTPMGRLLAQMLAVFAEFERGQIASRVKASYASRKARGVKVGPRPAPLDWDKFNYLKSKGLSVREIAKELAISKSQLYERLSRVG